MAHVYYRDSCHDKDEKFRARIAGLPPFVHFHPRLVTFADYYQNQGYHDQESHSLEALIYTPNLFLERLGMCVFFLEYLATLKGVFLSLSLKRAVKTTSDSNRVQSLMALLIRLTDRNP